MPIHPNHDSLAARALPRHAALLAGFLPQEMQARWLAMMHLSEEWQQIPLRTSEPMLGFIRLAWWKELLEEVMAGEAVRPHPLAQALSGLQDFFRTNAALLWSWQEAQGAMLEPAQGLSDEEWRMQARALEGGRLRLAAALWRTPECEQAFWEDLGEAWAGLWLLIELPQRIARREKWLPVGLMEAVDADAQAKDRSGKEIRTEVRKKAEALTSDMAVLQSALPILGPVSRRLARAYLAVMRHYLGRLGARRFHPWPPMPLSQVALPLKLLRYV